MPVRSVSKHYVSGGGDGAGDGVVGALSVLCRGIEACTASGQLHVVTRAVIAG